MLAMLVPNGIVRVASAMRLAEAEAVAEARAVEAGEALLLEALGHVDGGLAAAGDGGEADRGLARHRHGTAPPQRLRKVVSDVGRRLLGPYFTAG